MHKADKENIAFMTEHANHRYNAMPFGLKKAGEVHQRTMNNIFEGEIKIMLEVHMDYMIIKSTKSICMKVILIACSMMNKNITRDLTKRCVP